MNGTTGEGFFLSMCEPMKELELPATKLKRVKTDGASSMTGNETGLMGRIRREMGKQNPEFYMQLHCIVHQQSLCGKTLNYEHVTKVLVSAVNFFDLTGLIIASFSILCRK